MPDAASSDDRPDPDASATPVLWMVSRDLFFASKVRGPASRAGWGFKMSMHPPESGETPELVGVLLDLKLVGDRIEEVAGQIRQQYPSVRLVAFGPHVDRVPLAAARAAGVNHVVTNGQLAQNVLGYFS